MSADIKPGRYRIALVASPQPFIGQNAEYPVVEQIVTNPKYDIWDVIEAPEGLYRLILSRPAALFTREVDFNVIGDVNPPGTAWALVKEERGYMIVRPRTGPVHVVWTVHNPNETICPVVYGNYQSSPTENQLWKFYPVD